MSSLTVPDFGSLLRRHRRAAGLTQEELAERAGISVEAISALERGLTRVPHQDIFALLVEALHLSAQDSASTVAGATSTNDSSTGCAAWWASAAPLGQGNRPARLVRGAQARRRCSRQWQPGPAEQCRWRRRAVPGSA